MTRVLGATTLYCYGGAESMKHSLGRFPLTRNILLVLDPSPGLTMDRQRLELAFALRYLGHVWGKIVSCVLRVRHSASISRFDTERLVWSFTCDRCEPVVTRPRARPRATI